MDPARTVAELATLNRAVEDAVRANIRNVGTVLTIAR